MILFVILIMLAAGVCGGIVNIALGRDNQIDKSSFLRSIVTGVGAAFLMPILLTTVSSNLRYYVPRIQGELHRLLGRNRMSASQRTNS